MSASATAQAQSPASRLARWARQGIESFVAAQKILLDLTAQQNALAIGFIRERVRVPSINPGDMLASAADQGVANVTAAGKILLDLAAGEGALLADGVKEGLRLSPAPGAIVDVIRHRVDTLVEMQKNLLDATTEQTHDAVKSYKAGTGLNAIAHLAELARSGIEGFVATEKKFLDMVTEEVAIATQPGKPARKAQRDRSKTLAQLARQGVEQFIEAQKKLLDLAIEQFEAQGKVMGEVAQELAEEEPRTSWAEVTQRGVHNIVTAQKSLMDLAIRPARASMSAGTEERHVPPRRPRRKKTA